MTKGTFSISGRPDGGIMICVEDYNVEIMGGMDYEMMYMIDSENLKKFAQKLNEVHDGSLEQMVEAEFGVHLDKKSLGKWLEANDIRYEFSSWIS